MNAYTLVFFLFTHAQTGTSFHINITNRQSRAMLPMQNCGSSTHKKVQKVQVVGYKQTRIHFRPNLSRKTSSNSTPPGTFAHMLCPMYGNLSGKRAHTQLLGERLPIMLSSEREPVREMSSHSTPRGTLANNAVK